MTSVFTGCDTCRDLGVASTWNLERLDALGEEIIAKFVQLAGIEGFCFFGLEDEGASLFFGLVHDKLLPSPCRPLKAVVMQNN